jgi:hypothetical protein
MDGAKLYETTVLVTHERLEREAGGVMRFEDGSAQSFESRA